MHLLYRMHKTTRGSRSFGLHEIFKCGHLKFTVPYSGKLSREKTFANFAVLWQYAKVFSAKFGAWRPWRCKSEQIPKVFSAKIVFSPIRESFLPRKFAAIRYMATSKQADIHTTSANAVTLVWGSLRFAPITVYRIIRGGGEGTSGRP